ncbi:MAG: class IV adenylate cyclase [Saprospiraceae bacterium]
MKHLNIEIKARCEDLDYVREMLVKQQASYIGLDHQVDTYFKVNDGRLKLREGNIERALIHYKRQDKAGPKKSFVNLYKISSDTVLKEILTDSIGVLVIVDKQREIYFIENIKFHVDTVEGLGDFVEIEAIDKEGTIGEEKLIQQCRKYMDLFHIKETDLVQISYSDLLLNKES